MPILSCKWPECERPARTREYCQRDYYRAKTEGNFIDPWVTWVDKTHMSRPGRPRLSGLCVWPECNEQPKSNRMCRMHCARGFRLGNLVDPWLTWQKHPRCVTCGSVFQATRSTHKYCSAECNMAAWLRDNMLRYRALAARASARRRTRIANGPSEIFTTEDVRLNSGDVCYLCGEKINFRLKHPNPKSPSLDHVIALSRGGTHTLENVAMTHLSCNVRKHAGSTSRVPQPTIFAP